jgi:hypothetical protein
MDANEEGRSEDAEDDFFNVKKPTSWCECISMVLYQSEDRLLLLQNPDGLLYLTFLKQSGFLFLICKLDQVQLAL